MHRLAHPGFLTRPLPGFTRFPTSHRPCDWPAPPCRSGGSSPAYPVFMRFRGSPAVRVAPGGVEPPHTDSKSVALSAELRGPKRSVAAPPRRRAPPASAATAIRRTIREKSCAEGATFLGEVADGTRTHDHRDHNPGLYQLSYRHRGRAQDSGAPGKARIAATSLSFRREPSPPAAARVGLRRTPRSASC
jgi:hypothetical protein